MFENPGSTKTLLLKSSLPGINKLSNYQNQFSITLKCTEGAVHIFAAIGMGKGRKNKESMTLGAGSFAHPCTLMGKSSNRFKTAGDYNINTWNKGGRTKEKGWGKWHLNF